MRKEKEMNNSITLRKIEKATFSLGGVRSDGATWTLGTRGMREDALIMIDRKFNVRAKEGEIIKKWTKIGRVNG